MVFIKRCSILSMTLTLVVERIEILDLREVLLDAVVLTINVTISMTENQMLKGADLLSSIVLIFRFYLNLNTRVFKGVIWQDNASYDYFFW